MGKEAEGSSQSQTQAGPSCFVLPPSPAPSLPEGQTLPDEQGSVLNLITPVALKERESTRQRAHQRTTDCKTSEKKVHIEEIRTCFPV